MEGGGGGGYFARNFCMNPALHTWGSGGGGGYFAVHIVFLITGHVLLVIYQA